MIFNRIVEKVIAKEIEKFKENLIANKDAIIEKLKQAVADYIEEHKDDVLELLKDKATEIVKNILHK